MSAKRIRYADSALDDIASILATAHPLAAEYLSQAPVLAVLACGKFSSNLTYGELDQFSAAVADQPKLRALLARYGASAPARKISAAAIRLRDTPAVKQLLKLDPSSLSQCIPAEKDQRLWLNGIGQWMRLTPSKKADRERFSVLWVARHLAAAPTRCAQVDSIVDFVARGRGEINDKWSWERAIQAVEDWHKGLNDVAALRRMLADEKRRAELEEVICKAPIPDQVECEGLTFVALRTGRALQEEGVVMHHCVASYARAVRNGRCAIISIRRDGVHLATLELNAKGRVVQLKAHCNAVPAQAVKVAADTYALRNWRPQQSEAA